MKFEDQIKDHAARQRVARAMGGPDKLAKRKKPGILNARERIDYLLDKGSFRESGLFGVSYIPEMRESTPADGKVTGFGKLDGRRVGVVGYDFTVKGSSSSYTNNRKMSHVKDTGGRRGFPIVFLGESTGVRMPDIMGEGMGMNFEGNRFLRTREAPWAAAILGNAFGSAAWHACCSDFCVMRKGAVMAVASPRVVSMALGREVSPEELGGWQILAEHSGFADMRDQLSMDFARRLPLPALRDDTKAQIARILDAWSSALSRFGAAGGFLFGGFSVADCMYAPVVSRFTTYGVAVPPPVKTYMERMMTLPSMRDWGAAASKEVEAGTA